MISLFFCGGSALNFPSAARRITKKHGYERRHVKRDLAPNQKGPSYSQLLHEAWDAWPLPFFLFCFLSSSRIFLSAPWWEKKQPTDIIQWGTTVSIVPCNAWNYSDRHIRNVETETGYPIADKSVQIVGNVPASDGSITCDRNSGWHTQQPPGLETLRGTHPHASLEVTGRIAQAARSL